MPVQIGGGSPNHGYVSEPSQSTEPSDVGARRLAGINEAGPPHLRASSGPGSHLRADSSAFDAFRARQKKPNGKDADLTNAAARGANAAGQGNATTGSSATDSQPHASYRSSALVNVGFLVGGFLAAKLLPGGVAGFGLVGGIGFTELLLGGKLAFLASSWARSRANTPAGQGAYASQWQRETAPQQSQAPYPTPVAPPSGQSQWAPVAQSEQRAEPQSEARLGPWAPPEFRAEPTHRPPPLDLQSGDWAEPATETRPGPWAPPKLRTEPGHRPPPLDLQPGNWAEPTSVT